MSLSALSALFEYLCYGSTAVGIFLILLALGPSLYETEVPASKGLMDSYFVHS